MNKNNKPKKTIPIIVGTILLSSVLFCYIIFETEAIYDISVDNFYNLMNDVHRPISVTDVVRQLDAIEDSDDGTGGLPGGTVPMPDDPGRGEVEEPEELGDEVDRILADCIKVYDAPTVKSKGVFVDTTSAFDHHNKDYGSWHSVEFFDPAGITKTIQKRVSNFKVEGGTAKSTGSNLPSGSNTERYMVAVGPGIMNSKFSHSLLQQPLASDMHYGASIDVVLTKNGKTFYVPAVVADCKAHTYPTWIVQTGYAVQGGTLYHTPAGKRDNYTVPSTYDKNTADNSYYGGAAIEFVLLPSGADDEGYSLKGVIVY